MQEKYRLEDEITYISANMDSEQEKIETIHVYIVPGEEPEDNRIIDCTVNKKPDFLAYATFLIGVLLTLSCLALNLYLAGHPPIITITLIPKEQIIETSATLQIVTTTPRIGQVQGRLLPEITLSQSQTTATTGRGYQPATRATGLITFYNGQFSTVSIPAGKILNGSDGVQIVTDQDANIPPGNPPTYGQVTVSAHAVTEGTQGNIQAYDINTTCCSASVLAKNTSEFTGGQDAREYHTVAKADVTPIATILKATLAKIVKGALQGQLQGNETLLTLPCSPVVSINHQIGEEATTVIATATAICRGIAYDTQTIPEYAVQVLSNLAKRTVGNGFSLLGAVQVTNIQATTDRNTLLSYSCKGTWVYKLSEKEQRHIKTLIAGKLPQEAQRMLSALPGIQIATISGEEKTAHLPKNPNYLQVIILL